MKFYNNDPLTVEYLKHVGAVEVKLKHTTVYRLQTWQKVYQDGPEEYTTATQYIQFSPPCEEWWPICICEHDKNYVGTKTQRVTFDPDLYRTTVGHVRRLYHALTGEKLK